MVIPGLNYFCVGFFTNKITLTNMPRLGEEIVPFIGCREVGGPQSILKAKLTLKCIGLTGDTQPIPI
ncbi:MAG: hypothetical protein EBT30_08205 [Verrucomicrobia bacterium]|nr:hypothetical protein [Verrucomicrobiota bacterium]